MLFGDLPTALIAYFNAPNFFDISDLSMGGRSLPGDFNTGSAGAFSAAAFLLALDAEPLDPSPAEEGALFPIAPAYDYFPEVSFDQSLKK